MLAGRYSFHVDENCKIYDRNDELVDRLSPIAISEQNTPVSNIFRKKCVVIISPVLVDSSDAYLLVPYHNKRTDRATPGVYVVKILKISDTLMTRPYRLNNTLSVLMLNGFAESIVTDLRFAYCQLQLFSYANKSSPCWAFSEQFVMGSIQRYCFILSDSVVTTCHEPFVVSHWYATAFR